MIDNSNDVQINRQKHTICWVSWCLPRFLPVPSRSPIFSSLSQLCQPIWCESSSGTPCWSRPTSVSIRPWFLSLQLLTDIFLINLSLLFVVVLHVEVLNHLVLVLDVVFDVVQVVRGLPVIFLVEVVGWFRCLLGGWKDVFDCICHDEVFVRFQTKDRSIVGFRNCVLLVPAVIGEIADFVRGELPGGRVSLPMVPVCFFIKLSGTGFRSPLTWPKVLVSPYSVWAWSPTANYPPRLEFWIDKKRYKRFRCGVVAEGRAGGFDVGWEFWFVEGFFGGWVVFLGDNVVDGLLHLLLFLFLWKKYNWTV